MLMKLVLLVLFIPCVAWSQMKRNVSIYGYVEPYFCYDFNEPSDHDRANHIYSYDRHDEFNLNIGLLGIAVTDSSYRANLTLMTGTYAQANMDNEPDLLKSIFEANAGIRIRKKNDVWLDAGVLPSHIGFESAIGINCPTLTRSILADNTPYFETGLKLSMVNEKRNCSFAVLILNGWQRIAQRKGNSIPSLGTQITYTPNKKIKLNSSAFAGSDEPDSTRMLRYFHNLYFIWTINSRLEMTSGFDIGAQQKARNSTQYNWWSSAVIILRYQFHSSYALALRSEYYNDPGAVIVAIHPHQFNVAGFSVNLDYAVNQQTWCRVEFRSFHSTENIYKRNGKSVADDYAICASIALKI